GTLVPFASGVITRVLVGKFGLYPLARIAIAGGRAGVTALIATGLAYLKNRNIPEANGLPRPELTAEDLVLIFLVNFSLSVIFDSFGAGVTKWVSRERDEIVDETIKLSKAGMDKLQAFKETLKRRSFQNQQASKAEIAAAQDRPDTKTIVWMYQTLIEQTEKLQKVLEHIEVHEWIEKLSEHIREAVTT